MWNKKTRNILIVLGLLALGFFGWKFSHKKGPEEVLVGVKPVRGSIASSVSSSGTILPKNRLEVKPPVNGRIEEILVKEGEKVKVGQTLAWMSSTERAALLDAARGKGDESLKYWQQVYKPIALVSPIEGEVIVATTQPGQTVTTADAIVVLSDKLIARAQVDETDIGKVKEGQEAAITLDAYPDEKIKGIVDHIYHESQTVNNVTIYPVDVVPQGGVPQFFRSGMNAAIDFKVESRESALLLPEEAVQQENGEGWVLVKGNGGAETVRRQIKTGISDGKNIEIISGLNEDEVVFIKTKKYTLPKSTTGSNPFMPSRTPRK
jgi:membrane fusion protein, macrolide-specific efflux system